MSTHLVQREENIDKCLYLKTCNAANEVLSSYFHARTLQISIVIMLIDYPVQIFVELLFL